MNPYLEIHAIIALTAYACALPGVFLVLRKMSMMADAITHTVFLGIVIAFFMTQDLNSPWLLVGAALIGVVTVWCTEALYRTGLVAEDASIGIVFPLFFALGVIAVTMYGSHVHLDIDVALLGEAAFAPFDRWQWNGQDMGPVSLWVLGFVSLVNTLVIALGFKEFKLASFDALLAAFFGFSPVFLHYLLMLMVSVTVVASFQAVGAILVVGLMIGPPAAAYLVTTDLRHMTVLSALIGVACSLLGTELAFRMDVSIAGMVATVIGAVFFVTFLFSPRVGMLARLRRRRTLRIRYGEDTLLFHLLSHAETPEERAECGVGTIHEHLRWDPEFTVKIYRRLQKTGFVRITEGLVRLTDKGRERAVVTAARLFNE